MHHNTLRTFAASLALAAAATACTHSENRAASGGGTTAPAAVERLALGDPSRGGEVFRANCSRCHGQTGTEGGVGPSLARERQRKNYAQLVAWVMNPLPPMPKLYPAPLNERAVHDVAAYVEKL
jgi:ubiquinol-cytochrome c reductase cytochrome c subunit